MTSEIAQALVIGITLIGAVVWLISLTFLVKSARHLELAKPDDFSDAPAKDVLVGTAEVDGDAKTLAAQAATFLAKGSLGPLQIVEKTESRVVFERPDLMVSQPTGRWFRRGELRFTPLPQKRTRIEWTVEPGNFRWMFWLGGIIQFVGLIALCVGCWAMLTFVANSPETAVRWQSLQMLQVAHVLWPPFLVAGRYRQAIRAITVEFEALAKNLPYLGNQA